MSFSSTFTEKSPNPSLYAEEDTFMNENSESNEFIENMQYLPQETRLSKETTSYLKFRAIDFDFEQISRLMISYVIAVTYANIVNVVSHDATEIFHSQKYAHILLYLSTVVIFILTIMYNRTVHKLCELHYGSMEVARRYMWKLQFLNRLFFLFSILQVTIRSLVFKTKPPSVFVHLTPFLCLIFFRRRFKPMILMFMLILSYCLFLQYLAPYLLLKFFESHNNHHLFSEYFEYFEAHYLFLTKSINHEDSSVILTKQEVPIFLFFIGLLYHYQQSKNRILSIAENYYHLIRNVGGWIIRLDEKYNIEYVNKPKFFDFDISELRGSSILRFFSDVCLEETTDNQKENGVEKREDELGNKNRDSKDDGNDPHDMRCSSKLSIIRENLQGLFQNKKPSQFICQVKNEKYVEITMTPIITENQKKAALLLVQDVTERKLFSKTRKLMEKATLASNAKSRFISTLSHDIRTPLNSIVSIIQLLASSPNLSDEQMEYIEEMHSNSKLLTAIINDVLDISKIESGKLELYEITMNMMEVIETSIEMFYNTAAEKGLDLFCHVDVRLPSQMQGDRTRIQQILMNLIINGIKYTEKGFVQVLCVLESETESQCVVKLIVRDSGIGISDKDTRRLFSPFVRLRRDQNENTPGYGLGLSIVKALVQLMKGKIKVNSKLQKGSTFTVTIPFRIEKEPPTGTSTSTSTQQCNRTTILQNLPKREIKNLVMCTSLRSFTKTLVYYAKQIGVKKVTFASLSSLKQCKTRNEALLCEGVSKLPELWGLCSEEGYVPNKIIVIIGKGDTVNIPQYVLAMYNVTVIKKPIRVFQFATSLSNATKPLRTLSSSEIWSSVGTISDISKKLKEKNMKILIVEDNPTNRKVLTRLLQQGGLSHITTTTNGKEALEVVELSPDPFSCILMDLQMPLMDGFECTKEIRSLQDESKASTPIIALTGSISNSSISKCFEIGMNDVIPKPISATKLLNSLLVVKSNSIGPSA